MSASHRNASLSGVLWDSSSAPRRPKKRRAMSSMSSPTAPPFGCSLPAGRTHSLPEELWGREGGGGRRC